MDKPEKKLTMLDYLRTARSNVIFAGGLQGCTKEEQERLDAAKGYLSSIIHDVQERLDQAEIDAANGALAGKTAEEDESGC